MPIAQTQLALPAEIALPLICDKAGEFGAEVTRTETGAEIRGGSAAISVTSTPGSVALRIECDDAGELGEIRELVGSLVAGMGLPALQWQSPAPREGRKPRLTLASVVSVLRISPSFRRLRLAGDFEAFVTGGMHFRLLLGPDGADWPQPGSGGELIWPGGIDAWHRPPYTVRAIGPEADWIDVDIFLHDGGRITEWTADLSPGDPVALTGPGGRGVRQAGWLGLAGDETAMPVILRAIGAAAPETRGHAMILIGDPADAQEVHRPEGLQLDWVVRRPGVRLADLWCRLSPPAGDRFMFFAGERAEAQIARDHAQALGLGPADFHAAAYWTAGWEPPEGQRRSGRRG